jgi:L-rhamnonate dehydratase
MMAPEGDEVVPMVQPLLGEPAPVNGRMRLPETTGFGVELNPDVPLVRPIAN